MIAPRPAVKSTGTASTTVGLPVRRFKTAGLTTARPLRITSWKYGRSPTLSVPGDAPVLTTFQPSGAASPQPSQSAFSARIDRNVSCRPGLSGGVRIAGPGPASEPSRGCPRRTVVRPARRPGPGRSAPRRPWPRRAPCPGGCRGRPARSAGGWRRRRSEDLPTLIRGARRPLRCQHRLIAAGRVVHGGRGYSAARARRRVRVQTCGERSWRQARKGLTP